MRNHLELVKENTQRNIEVVKEQEDNIIKLPKLKKDGAPKQTKSNAKKNRDDVYPFKSEDIIKIIDYLNKCIKNSVTDQDKYISKRNRAYFVGGINISLRNSDFSTLTWGELYNKNWIFHDSVKLTPQKTKKYNKKVKIFFNEIFKQVMEDFRLFAKPKSLDEYIFTTRESDGKPMSYKTAWGIIDDIVKAVDIKYNCGTHSLRKTFGRERYLNSNDKAKTLIELMRVYKHEDMSTTLDYICITDDEICSLFNSVNLGLNVDLSL